MSAWPKRRGPIKRESARKLETSWKDVLFIMLLYVSVSVSFSLFMFTRLQILHSEWVKAANAWLYFVNYYGIAIVAPVLLSLFLFSSKPACAIFLVFIFEIAGYVFLLFGMLPDYLAMLIPTLLAIGFCVARYKPQNGLSKRKVLSVACLAISVSALLPHFSAYMCYNSILTRASSINGEAQQAMFVSDFVNITTTSQFPLLFDNLRADKDVLKFLLGGVGACWEKATATAALLNELDYEARIVSFPGEDHAFVEVEIDGKWMVLDPGYYHSQLLTREQRASRRIEEFGAISYVIAYVGSSFVELTPSYVPTDTVVIKITYAGEPFADAEIYLAHKFMNETLRIPDSTFVFYTDVNGTVILHLGALTYNGKARDSDMFYRIYVNTMTLGII